MEIVTSLLLFAIGVVLVVKGGDWFVDAASWIAKAANIPSFIIGATIVSLATTLPEMIVSVMASMEGKNEMAVGNAVGSVTANTGLIMALAFIFMTVITPRKKYAKQCSLLLVVLSVLWLGSRTGTLQSWASIVLIILFVVSMVLNVREAKNEPNENERIKPEKKEIWKKIGLFVVGATGIVVGSNCLITGGSDIATAFGVPERVIAVTMVAIGTSLPELVTTITAIKKKESSLSVGNIVGANIIDLALILPLCTAVSSQGFAISQQSLMIDFPFCFIVSAIAIVPLLFKQRAYKVQGIVMLAVYIGYLIITL